VPVESHFYEKGAHGLASRRISARRRAGRALDEWMSAHGFLATQSQNTSLPGRSPGEGWPKGIEGQRKADRGDGTFLNPILAGDHPDPSILKDGDDYYMTFSSFDAYPGLVIWHSRDLINWQPIGPTLFKNVGAVWAPDLVKHKGRYYIYFPGISPNRSNYVIWADNIRGPWSEPIDLKLTRIDPGHAVGPDGKRYLFMSAGELVQLATMGCRRWARRRRSTTAGSIPPTGLSKASRRKVRRSFSAATITTWCSPRAARPGRRPVTWWSPRDRRRSRAVGELALQPDRADAVARRALVVEGTRHARRRSRRQVVDGLSRLRERLSTRSAARRCSSRSSGRPTDGSVAGAIRRSRSRSRRGAGPHGFAYSDDFSKPRMGVQWSFYAGDEGDRNRYRYDNGTLVLKGKGTSPADSSPLWFVNGDHAYEMEVEIDADRNASAGLLVFYSRKLYAGLGFSAQNLRLHLYGMDRTSAKPATLAQHIWIRLRNDRHIVTVHYSADGKTWERYDRAIEVSGYHHNVAYDFLSLRPALYASGDGEVRFRNFKYRALP
jgi:hypothetical protein